MFHNPDENEENSSDVKERGRKLIKQYEEAQQNPDQINNENTSSINKKDNSQNTISPKKTPIIFGAQTNESSEAKNDQESQNELNDSNNDDNNNEEEDVDIDDLIKEMNKIDNSGEEDNIEDIIGELKEVVDNSEEEEPANISEDLNEANISDILKKYGADNSEKGDDINLPKSNVGKYWKFPK